MISAQIMADSGDQFALGLYLAVPVFPLADPVGTLGDFVWGVPGPGYTGTTTVLPGNPYLPDSGFPGVLLPHTVDYRLGVDGPLTALPTTLTLAEIEDFNLANPYPTDEGLPSNGFYFENAVSGAQDFWPDWYAIAPEFGVAYETTRMTREAITGTDTLGVYTGYRHTWLAREDNPLDPRDDTSIFGEWPPTNPPHTDEEVASLLDSLSGTRLVLQIKEYVLGMLTPALTGTVTDTGAHFQPPR